MDWERELRGRSEKEDIEKVRVYCRTGRPLGSDGFISKLESKLGRRLRALPVGRPKKKKTHKRSQAVSKQERRKKTTPYNPLQ